MADAQGTILVVDDTPANVIVLIELLQEEGYTIHEARDGVEALEAAARVLPDLILMDINMPRLNGFETCRRLKAEARMQHIPVVFVSAWGELDDKINGFKAGGIDYITRPFQIEEVVARVRTHITLARQRQQIMTLNRLKDQLVRTVSHDLKNPLTAIRGYVDLLIDEEDEQQRQKMYSYIRRSADRMYNLISKLLDLTHIEEGLTLTRKPTAAAAFIEDVLREFEIQAQARQVELIVKVTPPDLMMNVDALRLGQVLTNLVSNAMKYVPDGGHITIEADQEGELMRLRVTDDGAGIPPEVLPRLFETFYRAPTGVNRKIEGTGLGLSIVKGIVEQHGGTVTVESVVGQGTTFTVCLPL